MNTQKLKESLRKILEAIQILQEENKNLDIKNHTIDLWIHEENNISIKELQQSRKQILNALYH